VTPTAMHAVHAGYTVIARIKTGCETAVSTLLADFHAQPAKLPFAAMATTHFATGAVLPAQTYEGEQLPACLMIATSFSGPTRVHVDELIRLGGTGLRELFAYCEMFPGDCSDRDLERFLREHRQSDTFYSGMQHLTRADVIAQDQLRAAIQTFLDTQHPTGTPGAVRAQIQTFVTGDDGLKWAAEPWERAPGTWLALHWRTMIVLAIVGLFLVALLSSTIAALFVQSSAVRVGAVCGWAALVAAVLTLGGLVLAIRVAEAQQEYVAPRQPDKDVRSLDETQLHPVINEMTIVGPIKEGVVRPLVMRLALWIVARVAEGVPLPGLTGGINIPTVATARWIAIDGGKRLVFISNFTNASEPYVRDFIDIERGAMRINLTFGFGRGYPKTRWIIFDGAIADPNGFINVVHANQQHTELWYCPYKNLSIDNIRRNQQIREGLVGQKTDKQARAWLQLL
jgi:hypothetical protein